MAEELFANLAQTTVTTGGTTAPAQGTVETWVVASGATFPVIVAGVGQFHVQEDDVSRQSEICLVTDQGIGSLTTGLTNGQTAITSLAVAGGITAAITSGDSIVLNSGTNTQTVVASAGQIVGATSIAVTSFTANAAYGIGSLVRDLTNPGTATAHTVWLVTRGVEGTAPVVHTGGFTIVTTVTADVMTRVTGHEIGAAVSNQNFTIPSTNTWTDVPSMQMMVYAGMPWTLFVTSGLTVTTNGTPASTAISVQLRVVDAATSTIIYGYYTWQSQFNAVSFAYGEYKSFEQLNDALAVDTVVKLQALGQSNANYTFSTYAVNTTAGGITMQALRRA